MNPAVFREYDIRGVVGRDLDNDFVARLGQALGYYWNQRGISKIVLGMDARLSSPGFSAILKDAILGSGIDVVDLGMVPSPALYYALFRLGIEGGVQITGSHNPADNNGFKIAAGKTTIFGDEIQQIRKYMEEGLSVRGKGSFSSYDIIPEYVDEIVGRIRMGTTGLKVVIDPGNGAGGPSALAVCERLGVDVSAICLEPDGNFPNHHPDPTTEDGIRMLKETVLRDGADLGIGFDGDADRIGIVDAQGKVIYGDMITTILAREILARKPGATIVGEVKCSKVFFDEVVRLGGRPIMSKVGHSLMKDRLHAEKGELAGEMSGHIFFADRWFGFDDAVYAAARVLEILSKEQDPQALLEQLPQMENTPEIRIDCPDDIKFRVVEIFAAEARQHYEKCIDIDGVRFETRDSWGLVRPSNTQPVIVMRFESSSRDELERIEIATRSAITGIMQSLGVSG